MVQPKFVHLSLHSAYSLLEGAIHIKDLAAWAKAGNMPAVAITDTNNLFGALEFSETMKQAGIQPIIGCTLSIRTPYFKSNRQAKPARAHKIRLLARNRQGYKNLLKLVSRAHLEADVSDEPHRQLEHLKELSEGLIFLTGGPEGPVGVLIQEGRLEDAEALLNDLKALFPKNLYIEIMRVPTQSAKETEAAFLDFAYKLDLPLVATNEAFFIEEDMYRAHDVLICIAEGTYVAEQERRRLTPEHRLKTADEMVALFDDLPEALQNTVEIARRCAYAPESHDPILPRFADGGEQAEAELLKADSEKGLKQRLKAHVFGGATSAKEQEEAAKPYRERLAYELNIITKMGFPGYFLIVADFIKWAKEHDVPVGPGRGSGAGSVVAWALQITELDPLRFGLLFERFLNPERVSMPDFDIDFCQEKRDQVIHYVQEKYGEKNVAQIITFGTMNARGVLRDVGRVLQQPYPVTDRLCKMIPNNPASPVTLSQALKEEPRLREARQNDELTVAVIDRALKLEGLFRHASTHAAGVVIGDRPLEEMIPLYRDPRSTMAVTGYTMKWTEKAGLVKFDFLGLKTLTVLSRTIDFIRQRGEDISLEGLPLDNPAAYELIARGDTAGVFQLESSGMRSSLKALKPDKFEDIIAMVALYRPGPMENIPGYINRKHGREPVEHLHEWLQPLLEETYGVIIYQEQVMEIAKILAGYTLGEADLLRRAMGKKIKSEMNAQRKRFVDGAREKGVLEAKASHIFDLVAKFAGYGFNKSHAAAYALVAYQTAYFKANYPVEFMAATMSFERDNTDKLAMLAHEVRAMDIPLYPPDVNASEVNFSVQGEDQEKGIRYALSAVKNVGAKAMEAMVDERKKNGPYKDVFDLVERLEPSQMNKRQMENLIMAGALDGLNENRAQTCLALDMLLKHAHACHEARESAQENLFNAEGESPVPRIALPEVDVWEQAQLLRRERDALGFYFTSHPLEEFHPVLAKRGVITSAEAFTDPQYIGQTVQVAGVIEDVQIRRAAKTGKVFAFLALSDMAGSFEVLVFSDLLDEVREAEEADVPIIASISIDKGDNDDAPRMIMRSFTPFDPENVLKGAELRIFLESEEAVQSVAELLGRHKGGRGVVTLSVAAPDDDREVLITLADTHKVTPQLQGAIKSLPGVAQAKVTYR